MAQPGSGRSRPHAAGREGEAAPGSGWGRVTGSGARPGEGVVPPVICGFYTSGTRPCGWGGTLRCLSLPDGPRRIFQPELVLQAARPWHSELCFKSRRWAPQDGSLQPWWWRRLTSAPPCPLPYVPDPPPPTPWGPACIPGVTPPPGPDSSAACSLREGLDQCDVCPRC